ncbi:MAG: hypothetical protein ACE361_07665 [Aureliella sp.]
MRIQTFRCDSLQAAIQMVRHKLGPNASVIHVRNVAADATGQRFEFEVDATNDLDVPSRFEPESRRYLSEGESPIASSTSQQFVENLHRASRIALSGGNDQWTLVAARTIAASLRTSDATLDTNPGSLGFILASPALASSAIDLFQDADQHDHPIAVVSDSNQIRDALDRLACQRVLVIFSSISVDQDRSYKSSPSRQIEDWSPDLYAAVCNPLHKPSIQYMDPLVNELDGILLFQQAMQPDGSCSPPSLELLARSLPSLPLATLIPSNGEYQLVLPPPRPAVRR